MLLQQDMFAQDETIIVPTIKPFKMQLLKWIGNKQRFAHEIISYFPECYNQYIEPFLGSGAVLGTLAPKSAIAGDIYKPLMEIWKCLKDDPEMVYRWYEKRFFDFQKKGKDHYMQIRETFNISPNGADLLFLCRSCYGGVIRFRKKDGYMSTPCGIHNPISPESFKSRVNIWHKRTKNTNFVNLGFEETMDMAKGGDVVYCDPPYSFCQSILYGAQTFQLDSLLAKIAECKDRGVYVILSLDGSKKSGRQQCPIKFPKGLFEREVYVNCGQSMLRRFQMDGQILNDELVHDRLMLTF